MCVNARARVEYSLCRKLMRDFFASVNFDGYQITTNKVAGEQASGKLGTGWGHIVTKPQKCTL